jgi:Holliday junction DNA helicase RuvB
MIESNADETANIEEIVENQDEITHDIPTLRPQSLEDFIGQEDLKKGLSIFIEAARTREEPLDHMLFYGNPGLGKTTLAHIIANEMGANIRVTSGPALERIGDLAAILSNLKRGDILFIDEIHRMSRSIEEILYPAMEDFALDLIVGKGPSARTLRLNLEQFTVIGATTRLSMLSSPLRDRFGYIGHLEFYTEDDMKRIVKRSGSLLDLEANDATAEVIARRARSTPRIANRLLKRVRDFAEVKRGGELSPAVAEEALDMLSIDNCGLNAVDRRILAHIIEECAGGPIGIQALAAALQHEVTTLEEVHEPFLLKIGMLQRSPRGRMATKKAYLHLKLEE